MSEVILCMTKVDSSRQCSHDPQCPNDPQCTVCIMMVINKNVLHTQSDCLYKFQTHTHTCSKVLVGGYC